MLLLDLYVDLMLKIKIFVTLLSYLISIQQKADGIYWNLRIMLFATLCNWVYLQCMTLGNIFFPIWHFQALLNSGKNFLIPPA